MNEEVKTRVGILGGSFDPVHNGHMGLARGVLESFSLDHILFIPAHLSPHKQDRRPASSNHRLAMLQLAVNSQPGLLISEIELRKEELSYTIDTLSVLLTEYPGSDFFLIMGMDAFKGIKTWKAAQRIIESCHIIVAARPGFSVEKIEDVLKELFPDSPAPYLAGSRKGKVVTFKHREKRATLNFYDLPPIFVSSSLIRGRVNANEGLKNMLPPEVEKYIIENQLYRDKSLHP